MADNSTVLITGAGGFLGSHLVEAHLKEGYRVVALDNFCTGYRNNRVFLEQLGGDRLLFLEQDVCLDWNRWVPQVPAAWLQSLKWIFHFASPASPPLYQKLSLETMWVNTLGLNQALHFGDKIGARVVFSSTSEIYGDPLQSPQKESYWGNVNTVGPRSCYDESKRFGESLIYTHNQHFKKDHGFVRIFNTYGPRMNPSDGRVIVNFLTQALRRQNLTIYGDGAQTRSFCYVDDLIAGIIRFARKATFKGPVNLGNPKEFSIKELAEIVLKMFPQHRLKIEYLAKAVDDPQTRKPDISLAKRELDWAPTIELQPGLEKMLAWLETQQTPATP